MAKTIQDFGEKIGGAKKDLWRSRGIQKEEVAEMQQREYSVYITKDNVWPKPDFVALVEQGMPPTCAYFYKEFRDRFPSKLKPTVSEDSALKFITLLQEAKEVCDNLKTDTDLKYVYDNIFRAKGYTSVNYNIPEKAKNNPGLVSKMLKYASTFRYDYHIKDLADEALVQNFPYEYSIKFKGAHISHFTDKTYGLCIDSRIVIPNCQSREEVLEKVKELKEKLANTDEEKTPKKRGGSFQVVRPQLSHIQRTGPVLSTQERTGEELIAMFGFRGGEFGNWNSDADRQACLNHTYDAFCDLALCLNLPLKAMSVCGDSQALAIAFGARGSGNAAAHYEPERVVLNLTKFKGAGSLAHEWGHFLDFSLGRLFNSTKALSEIDIARSKQVKPNIYSALKDLINTIVYREMTQEEYVKDLVSKFESAQLTVLHKLQWYIREIDGVSQYKDLLYRMQDLRDKFEDTITFEDIEKLKEISAEMENNPILKGNCYEFNLRINVLENKYTQKLKPLLPPKMPECKTSYVNAAVDLDKNSSKAYFTLYTELFARAFESFVQDNLGYKSDYLVYGTTNNFYNDSNPYPAGKEREAINKAFKHLLSVIRDELFDGADCELKSNVKATQEMAAVQEKPIPKVQVQEKPKVEVATVKATPPEIAPVPEKATPKSAENLDFETLAEFREYIVDIPTWAKPEMGTLAQIKVLRTKLKQYGFTVMVTELPTSEQVGLAKSCGVRDTTIIVDSKATQEKQLQGLIELYIQLKAIATSDILKRPIVMEGGTYVLCKAMDLDVRVYCKSGRFNQFLHNPSSCKRYKETVSQFFN